MKRSRRVLVAPAVAWQLAGKVVIAVGLLWGTQSTGAAEAVADDVERFFETEVRPLLLDACGECHGARKAESGLRLDNEASLRTGGDSGSVIDLAQPDESLLLQVIGGEGGLEMPPDGKLSDAQIAVLRKWVRLGAPWPGESVDAANPLGLRGGPITDAERKHWAYQPVRTPDVPDLQSILPPEDAELAAWAETDIDRFILADLAAQGLRPVAFSPMGRWAASASTGAAPSTGTPVCAASWAVVVRLVPRRWRRTARPVPSSSPATRLAGRRHRPARS